MAWSFLMFAACATEPAAAPPAPAARPARAAPAAADDDDDRKFEGTLAATDVAFSGSGTPVLTGVAANGRKAADRAAFTFEGGIPGYHVGYITDPPVHCGSGEPVPVLGDAWLEVRLGPAAAHTEAGEATVGFQERALDLQAMRELQQVCDFEGVVTWVIGVAARSPYRVIEKQDPPRLLVDVGH